MEKKNKKRGRPCGLPSCSVPVRFPKTTVDTLRDESIVSGIPTSELIRRAVDKVYKKINKGGAK